MERELRAALADNNFAEGETSAGKRVLTQAIDKRNQAQDKNVRLEQELKDVRAQLSNAWKRTGG